MSKYGVFIIESLRADDVWEGEALDTILQACEIPVEYRIADDPADLERLLKEFTQSKLRYLHLSCHGNRSGIEINGERIANKDLEILLKSRLRNRRVFMASCMGGNEDLALRVLNNCGAYSLVGTPTSIRFEKSAVFWPAFYHLMEELDSKQMSKKNLLQVLRSCVTLFKIPINFYCRIPDDLNNIWQIRVRYRKTFESARIRFAKLAIN